MMYNLLANYLLPLAAIVVVIFGIVVLVIGSFFVVRDIIK